ncbi:hypothetical protein [Cognatilysobacter bugurensis]|uniref:Uncharacterized protein n=1 Tax=Cognatilysobacter bugurensis TaxID=543356 RepID=A0A918SVR7_9GAMM|nr:hypothetical protein [Lysobacter bugurensis]GHA73426.1 hypothetical protein GCM10007067_07670 [Lysobacter bugurensis]
MLDVDATALSLDECLRARDAGEPPHGSAGDRRLLAGDLPGAIEGYRTAPDQTDAALKHAWCLAERWKLRQAAEVLDNAEHSSSPESLALQLRVLDGASGRDRSGSAVHRRMQALAERLYDVDPSSRRVMSAWWGFHMSGGRYAQMRAMALRAAEFFPDDAALHQSILRAFEKSRLSPEIPLRALVEMLGPDSAGDDWRYALVHSKDAGLLELFEHGVERLVACAPPAPTVEALWSVTHGGAADVSAAAADGQAAWLRVAIALARLERAVQQGQQIAPAARAYLDALWAAPDTQALRCSDRVQWQVDCPGGQQFSFSIEVQLDEIDLHVRDLLSNEDLDRWDIALLLNAHAGAAKRIERVPAHLLPPIGVGMQLERASAEQVPDLLQRYLAAFERCGIEMQMVDAAIVDLDLVLGRVWVSAADLALQLAESLEGPEPLCTGGALLSLLDPIVREQGINPELADRGKVALRRLSKAVLLHCDSPLARSYLPRAKLQLMG